MELSGRLELTWTNKHLRLISAAEDGYEWVDPTDPRVSEVRLLNEVDTIGDDSPDGGNLLIEGDALHALTALNRIPDLARRYSGQVRLVYIDPPFNTGQAFANYDDNLEHSVWLSMLRDRLVQIKPLLAANGSIWVHLDDAEVHRCRVVMDEVLGPSNFVAEVVWQKADSPRSDAMGLSISHDSLLVYRRSPAWRPNRLPRLRSTDATFGNQDGDPVLWRKKDPTAPGAATHQGMVYAVQHPIGGHLVYPGVGRCWAMEQSWMLTELANYARYELRDIGDEEARSRICGVKPERARPGVNALMLVDPLDKAAVQAQRVYDAGTWPTIYLTGPGGRRGFQRKQYISDTGRVPETWWSHEEVGHNRAAKNEIKALFPGQHPFATPKPERLLQRIIRISSDPGDLVLDCFAGSGTTAAVAHKMRRRWVTVEREQTTIESFTKPRLTKVVNNDDPGGVTSVTRPTGEGLPDGLKSGDGSTAAKALKALFDDGRLEGSGLDKPTMKAIVKSMREAEKTETETVWSGGGGFRHLQVGPSMFDLEAETGDVFLAEWATNGAFSEAVAAQLGFERIDAPPFCGRKGRTRLAVLDGVVGPAEVEFLVAALDERERVIVVGQAFTEDADSTLRALSPGSRVRHAPHDLLRRGGRR